MKYIGYIFLSIAVIGWVLAVIVGMVAAFPEGLIGLIPILGVGFLFAYVVKQRLENKEDDYYSKNVHK